MCVYIYISIYIYTSKKNGKREASKPECCPVKNV